MRLSWLMFEITSRENIAAMNRIGEKPREVIYS